MAVGSSKTAVDSIEAVYFAAGIVKDNSADVYSFMKPCPPTSLRIPVHDRQALADRTPRFRSTADTASGGEPLESRKPCR